MGWMQLVSNVAWPFVALAGVMLFRIPLKNKLGELTHIVVGNKKVIAKFARKTKKEAESSTKTLLQTFSIWDGDRLRPLPTPTSEETPLVRATLEPQREPEGSRRPVTVIIDDPVWADLFEWVRFDAREAVAQGYELLEKALARFTTTDGSSLNVDEVIEKLRTLSWVPQSFNSSIKGLLLLGRQATRSEHFPITETAAVDYLKGARTVTGILNQVFGPTL